MRHGALCDHVALGLAYIGGRTVYAQELGLLPQVLGHIVGPMIVAQLQPEGPILSEPAKVSGDPLSDRLQSFPAGGLMGRMGSDEFAGAVIDGEENIGPSLIHRDGLGHVRPPDLIHALSDNGPGMRVLVPNPGTMERELAIFLHDPSHPPRRRTDAFVPKPSTDLAAAFALKGTGSDLGLDMNSRSWSEQAPTGPRRRGGLATSGSAQAAVP